MSGIVAKVDWKKLFESEGYQVERDVAAGATSVINFLQEFEGIAKFVLLDNRDAVNEATYRVNSRAALARNIRVSSSRVVGVAVELLEVNAGAAGGVQVSAEIVPRKVLGI